MKHVNLSIEEETREKYRMTMDKGSAEVTVQFSPSSKKWTLEANFVPLEQREFVDALDRALPFEEIAKDGRGGCLIQGPVPEGMTRTDVVLRIGAVYGNTIVDG